MVRRAASGGYHCWGSVRNDLVWRCEGVIKRFEVAEIRNARYEDRGFKGKWS